MKSIDLILKNSHSKKLDSVCYEDKENLFTIYEEPNHTSAGKRILAFQLIATVCILCFIMMGAASGFTLYDAVKTRTSDRTLKEDTLNVMVENASKLGETPQEYVNRDYNIEINSNGTTYGHIFDGVELVAVSGVKEHSELTGYVYSDDLQFLNDDITSNARSIDEILQRQKERSDGLIRNWIYVYDSDGYTVIGKYIHEYPKEEQIPKDNPLSASSSNFEYGFYTNEQLNSNSCDDYIINGTDSDEYIKMAQDRSLALNESNR